MRRNNEEESRSLLLLLNHTVVPLTPWFFLLTPRILTLDQGFRAVSYTHLDVYKRQELIQLYSRLSYIVL